MGKYKNEPIRVDEHYIYNIPCRCGAHIMSFTWWGLGENDTEEDAVIYEAFYTYGERRATFWEKVKMLYKLLTKGSFELSCGITIERDDIVSLRKALGKALKDTDPKKLKTKVKPLIVNPDSDGNDKSTSAVESSPGLSF